MYLHDIFNALHRNRKVTLLLVFLLLCLYIPILAQNASSTIKTDDRKEIEIINANSMSYSNTAQGEIRFLNGDVKIKHEKTYMECDSAIIFMSSKTVNAFGHVYINNNDSLDIYCDMAKYFGTSKLAGLYNHVVLINGKLKLESPEVFYDMNTSIGNYSKGGTVLNGDTKIASNKGTYYDHTSDVYFQDDVRVTNPKFSMTCDTLQYNTNRDLATFYSQTKIVGDNSTIYCYTGHYDTKREVADFGANTTIESKNQTLHTDSLYYDSNNSIAKTYLNFTFTDEENNLIMTGTKAIYREESKYLLAWQRPLLTNIDGADSLFMKADTIISYSEEASAKKFFTGYRNVRMFKKDMQAACDSIYYSSLDSTFKMFIHPVLWSDSMQITGDTIFLLTKDKKADQLRICGNGFITMPSNETYYNQLKGMKITGYIIKNTIETMDIEGNAESIYYLIDDADNHVLGNNKASCMKMKLSFIDKKLDRVKFMGKPEALFTPTSRLTDEVKLLKGFSWQMAIRPNSPADL